MIVAFYEHCQFDVDHNTNQIYINSVDSENLCVKLMEIIPTKGSIVCFDSIYYKVIGANINTFGDDMVVICMVEEFNNSSNIQHFYSDHTLDSKIKCLKRKIKIEGILSDDDYK